MLAVGDYCSLSTGEATYQRYDCRYSTTDDLCGCVIPSPSEFGFTPSQRWRTDSGGSSCAPIRGTSPVKDDPQAVYSQPGVLVQGVVGSFCREFSLFREREVCAAWGVLRERHTLLWKKIQQFLYARDTRGCRTSPLGTGSF